MSNRVRLLNRLQHLSACSDSVRWVSVRGYDAIDQAWDDCDKPDWLLWLLYRLSPERYVEVVKKVLEAILAENPYDLSPFELAVAAEYYEEYKLGHLTAVYRAERPALCEPGTRAFCVYVLSQVRVPLYAALVFDYFLKYRPVQDSRTMADLIRRAFSTAAVRLEWDAFWRQVFEKR